MYQTIEKQPADMKTICVNPYSLFLGLPLKRSSYGTGKGFGGNRQKIYEDSTVNGYYYGNNARKNDLSIPSVSELKYTVD